jgi:hypothetical protein
VIGKDGTEPSYIRAHFLIADAYQATLGSDADPAVKLIQGRWDMSKRGFFVSGHILKEGGQPNVETGKPPSGAGDQAYSYGTESQTWQADVFWSISYTVNASPVECIIQPDPDYDKWEPEGGADVLVPGNHLNVSA